LKVLGITGSPRVKVNGLVKVKKVYARGRGFGPPFL
jgi:hypothetical protein